MIYIIISVVVLLLGVGVWLWLRRRSMDNEADHRLISIVGLVKEPKYLDASMIAKAAATAWKVDLGTDEEEGKDGFVVGVSPSFIIQCRNQAYLINTFPTTYVEDIEELAESIPDVRLRNIILQHEAWFSCDAMGVDADTSEKEVKQWYTRLGKLFAELMDEDCLGVFLPDANRLYANNSETIHDLRSGNVVNDLQVSVNPPMIEIKDDDPAMQAAVAKARKNWPKFVAAYENEVGKNFSVKSPITRGGNTEFIWLHVTAIENDFIYGELSNDPVDLPGLKLGSQVKCKVATLNDWLYITNDEKMKGGYTVKVVEAAMKRQAKQ